VIARIPDARQVLRVGHATIDDHRAVFAFAHPHLQYLEHVDHSGGVTAIASKDFMRFGETIPVERQPYSYLFAVGSGVARIAAPI
jgi:hypothetical protein